MIKVNGISFDLKLEPVVNIFDHKVKGYEILSIPHDLSVNSEVYFKSLSDEILVSIFYEQLSFFSTECLRNPVLGKSLFINTPLSLVTRENFTFSIHKYIKLMKLNIEIQYDYHILKSQSLRRIRHSLPCMVNIWIDDVDFLSEKETPPVPGVGLKIDKYSFWKIYEGKSDMSELYSYCPERLIIEGIETMSHLEYLRNNNITLAQGYYWPSKKY